MAWLERFLIRLNRSDQNVRPRLRRRLRLLINLPRQIDPKNTPDVAAPVQAIGMHLMIAVDDARWADLGSFGLERNLNAPMSS